MGIEGRFAPYSGASGDGHCGRKRMRKTTLIKLLQGFYEPTRGSIKVGGVNLSDINPHTWRAATGSVMQDSFIFSDTIEGNIAFNTDEADKERMKSAARMARIDDLWSLFLWAMTPSSAWRARG